MFGLKALIWVTGAAFCFFFYKSSKLLVAYSSLYILTPVTIAVAWLADRILGSLVASAIGFILLPPSKVAQSSEYFLRQDISGFLGRCCDYTIYERRWGFLEQEAAHFYFQSNLSSNEVSLSVDPKAQGLLIRIGKEGEKGDIVLVVPFNK
ncbi:hypothetical protein ACFQHR_13280 [Rufibacter roseus]|uniref:DUF4131 domain-containing protein n=2 Tax=Rufibacter roseus TaxID=1567108 RepID=A0ABW2DQN0_9BACT